MDITITVPDDKIDTVKANVLAVRPIPTDEGTGEPLFSDLAWIKKLIMRELKKLSDNGSDKLARDASPPVDF